MAKVEAAIEGTGSERMARFWATLGPGLLWAAAAIGVSHLVQSTRAGADGGFSLVWVVLVALVVKYPFFEYGPRYAAATGESLVEGYYRLGRWAVWTYLLITLASAVIIQAAVTLFTAFVFANVLGVDWSMAVMGAIVLTGCGLLLWIGKFEALDKTIKVILAVLAVCTLIAAASMIPRAGEAIFTPWPVADTPEIHWVFILALVGWMPSAIDISVWSSLWTLAKDKSTGVKASVGDALLDFRIGYFGTGFIALAFLTLGATVMFAANERFSPQGAVFSLQLVDLYSATLGAWARPVILIAVLTTMFSTTLTVLDGFPRAIARSFRTLQHGIEEWPAREQVGRGYWVVLVTIAVLTVIVFQFFAGNLTTMVDFATLVAFVTAPVLGYLNLRAVTMANVPEQFQPSARMRLFSNLGLVLMGGIALIFVVSLVL
jgi:Mn2+/Fe2+ NRAMP family transporter